MKRAILLILPLLLLIVLTVVVVAMTPEKPGFPAEVQTHLEQYVTHVLSPETAAVHQVVRARRPWLFAEDMSRRVFGDSVYFQTEQGLTRAEGGGPSPLPFPPKELWCALLEQEGPTFGTKTYTVLFVGLHMDMYNGDWIIHEGARNLSSLESIETLSLVSCDLELD